jgi:hypothetical protein
VVPVGTSLINLQDVRTGPPISEAIVRKLGRFTYRKVVRKHPTRRDSALCDSYGTVHIIGAILEKPVEMQTGALIPELVDYIDDNSVPNGGCKIWKRPLVVDANNRTGQCIIGISGNPGNVPVVSNSCGVRYEAKGKK